MQVGACQSQKCLITAPSEPRAHFLCANRKLRFSESWALKKVQLKGIPSGAGRNNATFRADSTLSSSASGPLKVSCVGKGGCASLMLA